MPNFANTSRDRLALCHPDLKKLFNEVIKYRDCTVLCGHRGKVAQEAAKNAGTSKAGWGESKHNFLPALAVDVMPWPLKWDDKKGLHEFAAFVKATAFELNLGIRWGGDFKNFFDGPHYELTAPHPESKLPE